MVLFMGSMTKHLMCENSVLFDGTFSAVFLPPPSIIYNAVLSVIITRTEFDGHLTAL